MLLAVASLAGCGGSYSAEVPAPKGMGVALEWNDSSCVARNADRDLDGLEDACELALAKAFSPLLVVSPSCAMDGGIPAGGYGFVVTPRHDARGLLIGYAPAYVRDCGWSGAKCWLRWRGGCDGHWGDSEFIGIEVAYDGPAQTWVAEAIFLSAHCFGRSDADCRWYEGADLGQFSWVGPSGGAARVWVAEGKNANYPSREKCERGHWWFDTCERNEIEVRYPIHSNNQNLGEPLRAVATQQGGSDACFTRLDLGWTSTPAGTAADAVECFGGPVPFAGWTLGGRSSNEQLLPEGSGSTPYARYFALLAAGSGTRD